MKLEEGEKNHSDIHMNTKLIHYDQCYYNEHKINSSQWNTQSTTHLLYLLTKNNRTIILHWGDTRGYGHCCLVSHTRVYFPGSLHQEILTRRLFATTFTTAQGVRTYTPKGSPLCCGFLPRILPRQCKGNV